MPRRKQKLTPGNAKTKTAAAGAQTGPHEKQKQSPPLNKPAAQKTKATTDVEYSARPDLEFAREFFTEANRDFAFRHEEAVRMESELESEMSEQTADETWMTGLMGLTRGATPLQKDPEQMFQHKTRRQHADGRTKSARPL